MKSRRVGNCIFADDIRHEVGNKFSLMGIYGTEIISSGPPPFVLPRFACLVHLISDVGDLPREIVFRVLVPSGGKKSTEIFKHYHPAASGPVYHAEGAVNVAFRSIIEMSTVLIPSEGFVEVWADVDGESIRCGRLMVKFTPVTGLGDK
jgi:hypothetical protein